MPLLIFLLGGKAIRLYLDGRYNWLPGLHEGFRQKYLENWRPTLLFPKQKVGFGANKAYKGNTYLERKG